MAARISCFAKNQGRRDHKDGASFRLRHGLFEGCLQRIPWNQVSFVQLREPASQLFNARFIGTTIRKKDVSKGI
jgi:hypothetical protein